MSPRHRKSAKPGLAVLLLWFPLEEPQSCRCCGSGLTKQDTASSLAFISLVGLEVRSITFVSFQRNLKPENLRNVWKGKIQSNAKHRIIGSKAVSSWVS